MSLQEALMTRGYPIRQHLEEEGWGWRKPTVVDLDIVQSEMLKDRGIKGLKEVLSAQMYRPPWGVFTFPALDIETPLPRRRDLLLARDGIPGATVVAPKDNPALWELARQFVKAIQDWHGITLPLLGDEEVWAELLDTQHVVLIGGSHQNRLALRFALRYRTFFVDASVPGEDGWVATTHCGINATGNNILQVAASAADRRNVLSALLEEVAAEEKDLVLRHVHRIQPGRFMAEHFPSWEKFAASLPGRIPQLNGRKQDVPTDIGALAGLLALGFESGGIEKNYYNSAPLDIAIDCARYYQLSGDARALALFRELLFRLADYYLKTPGGASYPSDMDFRLGMLILHYARLEFEPEFSDDDRLILVNLLLSCARAVHEYAIKMWPVKPGSGPARHNHPTFKALTLFYAADYFKRYNIPYVKDWLAYTEAVLGAAVWTRSKQTENARSYEAFVYEHAAEKSLFAGKVLEIFQKGCFEKLVGRQIVATDNFMRPVDYGDTAIDMKPSLSGAARLLAARQEGPVRWFVWEGFARNPDYLPIFLRDFPGILAGPGTMLPAVACWEEAPMDQEFLAEMSAGFPIEFAFDKLAFRTGWKEEDQYLLLEGVGCKPGHSHNEANGIVRLNHLGRHWIVSNGYGRRVGVTNVANSFNSRERGPVDHNMLVLRRGGGIANDLPMSALLQKGQCGRLLYSTSALLGYGGTNWFRTLVIFAGAYLLVIDRVQVLQEGLEAAHFEWNALGAAKTVADGFRLDQQGVLMDVTSPSGWRSELGVADQSACWQRVLSDGSYPYAKFPLTKMRFHMPGVADGHAYCLATLLAATRSQAEYAISQPESGRILVAGPHDKEYNAKDGDLAIHAGGGGCEVQFAQSPDIPGPLGNPLRANGAERKE